MLPRQVMSYGQLLRSGLKENEIYNMYAALKIFPTPFKGIYYIPSKEERDSWSIEKPLLILARAIALFLRNDDFYYSCRTAEEFWGLKWQPAGETHIVNEKISDRIEIKDRVGRNIKKTTFRAKKIAKILELYGNEIILHKVKSIKDAKIKETPYGRFAFKSQIKKDKKRFRN